MNNKQDLNGVRTAQDLERKYDFASLLGLKKNIKLQEQNLTKISNELNNMLNSLIINLADVLDSQSEISLWFYSGQPTTANEPYIDWQDYTEHFGDIYYDQETGYVYQFTENGWQRNTDTNLVQAMALTNVELDVSTDHERKVYFSQPTVPYSSGDWWILEDGTLKICQIGKTTGSYEEADFVVSSKYTSTLATKTDNTITVLKGTVTTISENAVTFTDLETQGSTSINGANITTGNINVSGDVTIGNNNVLINTDGIKLNNGAKLVGGDGLYTNLSFSSMNWKQLGFYVFVPYQPIHKTIEIGAFIPDGFKIDKAFLTVQFHPLKWYYGNSNAIGYCRNINLYYEQLTTGNVTPIDIVLASDNEDVRDLTNNTNKLNKTGSTSQLVTYTSDDLKDFLTAGQGTLFQLRTSESSPSASSEWGDYDKNRALRTGYARAMLNVYGYMKYSQ